MSPLRVELYKPELHQWVQAGRDLSPSDPPGTVSSNLPNGKREIYQFFCTEDDSHSVIQRLPGGVDAETGRFRIIDAEEMVNAVRVATLRRGDEPYRLTVKTDRNSQRKIIRFIHR